MQNRERTEAAFGTAVRALREGTDGAAMSDWLRSHLFEHVLSFWEEHGNIGDGGITTCLRNDGTLVSEDRWLWSQWRAVWVYSRLYRTIARESRWLDHARRIAGFCVRHGWLSSGEGWALVVGGDGRVLREHESTYVDAFAVYGLVELYRATNEAAWLDLARRTGDVALAQLARPYDTIPHFPYPIPAGTKPHGIPMLWSLAFAELAQEAPERRWKEASIRLSEEIFRDFFQKDRDLMVEFVSLDGRALPAPLGTAVVPGHVIEDAWFQRRCCTLTGYCPLPPERIWALALRHMEIGWDKAVGEGGLLLAVDADNDAEVGWKFPHTKLWWPHTEALYTSLLAWRQTGSAEFLDWYERVWRLCLKKFVDWENGEWVQKLDRDFRLIDDVVALPVKDPFHLPRSLILQIEALT